MHAQRIKLIFVGLSLSIFIWAGNPPQLHAIGTLCARLEVEAIISGLSPERIRSGEADQVLTEVFQQRAKHPLLNLVRSSAKTRQALGEWIQKKLR
jgi:hypothetical protein